MSVGLKTLVNNYMGHQRRTFSLSTPGMLAVGGGRGRSASQSVRLGSIPFVISAALLQDIARRDILIL